MALSKGRKVKAVSCQMMRSSLKSRIVYSTNLQQEMVEMEAISLQDSTRLNDSHFSLLSALTSYL